MNNVLYFLHKSRFAILFCICLMLITTSNSFGKLVVQKSTPNTPQAQSIDPSNMTKDEIIATLKKDIKAIDEQMAQCTKQKKGWTAATIIGGVGVVGTGIGAIIQGKQIKDKKTDLQNAQDTLRGIK